MPAPYKAIISLHGIRTRGVWQKELVPELAMAGFIPFALDYGQFGVSELFLPGRLNRSVAWLVERYDQICAASGDAQPSVIAHSYGTLQVARLLQTHQHVRLDKLILVAGIVPTDYPWADLLEARRVNWVQSDYAPRDIWPRLARWLVPNAGDSGSRPFTTHHRALHQVAHRHHRHSSYFVQGQVRGSWLPTLRLDKRRLVDVVHDVLGTLGQTLGLPRNRLRGFVRTEVGGALSVVPGVWVGDASERELALAIPLTARGPGAGPVVAYQRMREVRQARADIERLHENFASGSPLHPELAWSVSLPIPQPGRVDAAIGVLTLDGLAEPSTPLPPQELMAQPDMLAALEQIGQTLDKGLVHLL